jgi:Domain of unknown function (DUF4258)
MEVVFHIDPETGEPHIYGHSVTEEEVLQVLAKPGQVVHGRDASDIALGQTEDGRYLKVVYAPRRDGPGVFVVTAHELHGKALRAYRRYRRRMG